MFTIILEKNLLFYLMIVCVVLGAIGKLMSSMTMRRLTKAAENISKSEHRLMKLIRAKFEHASMVSGKVQNVDAFVDKYLYEYKVGGFRIHTWRELEKQMIWLYGIIAASGAFGCYSISQLEGRMPYYAGLGIGGMALLYLLYQWGDESHAWTRIHTYIVDYLENVCVHRMNKIRQTPEVESVPKEKKERKPVFPAEQVDKPLYETVEKYYDLPVKEKQKEIEIPVVNSEQRRENAREKVREAMLNPEGRKQVEDSKLAIQLDEARKNIEKDAEERKLIIREILEQYLA